MASQWYRVIMFQLILCAQIRCTLATVVIEVKPESDEISHVASRLASTLAQNDGNVDVVINLHGGSHHVPEGGLVLDHRHTPSEGHHVHWIGNGVASISGAIAVTGWRPSKANTSIFVAPAPSDLHGAPARHLWVDGRRASRTRTTLAEALPANTHLSLSSDGNGYTLNAGGGGGGGQRCAADHGKDTPCCGQPSAPGTHVQPAYQCPADKPKCVDYVYDHHWGHCTGGTPPNPPVPQSLNWANPSEVEFVYSGVAQGWSEARCAVRAIANSTITMRQPCFWNLVHRMWQPVKGAPPVYVENVREQLHTPGTFYHDQVCPQPDHLSDSTCGGILLTDAQTTVCDADGKIYFVRATPGTRYVESHRGRRGCRDTCYAQRDRPAPLGRSHVRVRHVAATRPAHFVFFLYFCIFCIFLAIFAFMNRFIAAYRRCIHAPTLCACRLLLFRPRRRFRGAAVGRLRPVSRRRNEPSGMRRQRHLRAHSRQRRGVFPS